MDLVSFCCVLQRFGVALLRSASIWGRFASFCIKLGPFCTVVQRFGVVLLRSALTTTKPPALFARGARQTQPPRQKKNKTRKIRKERRKSIPSKIAKVEEVKRKKRHRLYKKASRGPSSRDVENAPRHPGVMTAIKGKRGGHGGLQPQPPSRPSWSRLKGSASQSLTCPQGAFARLGMVYTRSCTRIRLGAPMFS